MGSMRDRPYIPVPTYVLDPIELTAMGIQVAKRMKGEEKWEDMKRAKWQHPDGQKTYCFAYGALIHVHPFPDRSAPGMRPPEAWLHEARITEATKHEARKLLDLQQPAFSEKRALREAINEQMDSAHLASKAHDDKI